VIIHITITQTGKFLTLAVFLQTVCRKMAKIMFKKLSRAEIAVYSRLLYVLAGIAIMQVLLNPWFIG